MIKRTDYCASEYLDMFGRSYISKKGTTMSLDHRVDRIYSWYAAHKKEAKTYLLANTIVQRIANMDISKLSAEMILALANNHNNECGVILDAVGQPIKVSCTFLIQLDSIIIEVFSGNFSNCHTVRYENGREDLAAFSKCFVGCVVISELGIEKVANNPYKLLETGVNFQIESYYREALLKMNKEIVRAKLPTGTTLVEAFKTRSSDFPYCTAQYKDLCAKSSILEYAMKAFLYIHSSDSIKADYISEDSAEAKRDTKCLRNYILVDSLWDMEVNVLNPFGVSGHFTHQPYGKGRALRKLIYIEPYMKKGYHRKPGKEIK